MRGQLGNNADEVLSLQRTVQEVEAKNKKLGELLNKGIHDMAAGYKARVADSLRRRGGPSEEPPTGSENAVIVRNMRPMPPPPANLGSSGPAPMEHPSPGFSNYAPEETAMSAQRTAPGTTPFKSPMRESRFNPGMTNDIF